LVVTALAEAPPVARSLPAADPPAVKRRRRRWIRVLSAPVTVFLIASFLTYGLGALSPSNPAAAVLGETATPADIARMNHEFGLDRPFLVQYVDWLGGALRGDL